MNAIVADARRGHRGLFWLAVSMVVLSAALLVLAAVDTRTLLGQPLWFKPLKFAVSFTAYAGTLAWMLGQLSTRRMQRTGWVVVAACLIEMAIITGQAARGQRSHFNTDSATGSLLYSAMGVTIVVLYVATVVIATRFLREPGRDRATGMAVKLGLGVSLLGMAVGFLMVAGSAHAVGVADGGPGLPFVGWSTTGGDLRVAHFVGMHTLQLMPLLAACLTLPRFSDRLDALGRTHVVVVAAVSHAGLVLGLTWQALRAQPVLSPDLLTVVAFAALVVLTVGALLGVAVRSGRRTAASPELVPETTAP